MADTEKSDSGKSQPLPWIVLSGIVGLFAVGVPATSGSKDTGKPATKIDQPADNAPPPRMSDSLLKPLEEFHSVRNGTWNGDDLVREVHGYKTEFLIATVPDPIDTPFGYAFDQVVDAIQRGVQQKDGYLLDRAWVPWDVDRQAKPTDPKPSDGKPAPGEMRYKMPGILLFRHGKDAAKKIGKPSACVVFLVGETPLGGIRKEAFWQCLTLIAGAGHHLDDPIRVVGPYFTGSQTSLQFLLADWYEPKQSVSWLGRSLIDAATRQATKFKVIFGNASAIRSKEFFRSEWGPDKLEIGATVAPARVQLNAILRFLTERDGARASDSVSAQMAKKLPGRLAILAESNTGFGKQFAAYGEQSDVAVLRFPLNISRLKSEYAQVFKKKDEQAGLPSAATISPAGFEESTGATEGVQLQGGAATTAANNAVLANILSTISRDRYRYVGVMATDTRDKLFLVRLIREYCPDVHIFVTEADVLLTHPDYRYHMKGVLVGSTYPLFPPNQQWVNPNGVERLLLSSSAAQGYYNATLAVFGLSDKMLEYGPPGFATGPDVPNDRPPVWVSMIAPSGALVPLQLFTGYEDTNNYVWRKPDGGTAPAQTDLRAAASLYLTGLGLALFWAVLLAKCWRGRGMWATAAPGSISHVGVFRTVLLGAQLVFAIAVAALASTRLEHTGYRSPADWAMLGGAALAWGLFMLTAARGVSFQSPAVACPALRRWRWDGLNLLFIAGLVMFTVLFLGRFWEVADRPHRALFFVRTVDLATGLSPLTPLFLMCMAVTAGAYFQLERHELARRCRVPSPFPSDSERLFDALTDQDRRLKVEMTPGRFWKRHRIPIVALGAALLLVGTTVWAQSLPTIEGVIWDWAFTIGFGSIYAFAAVTILQTLVLWWQTKHQLENMAQIPMIRVFARLPGKLAGAVTKHLFTRTTQPLLLQVTVHQLRHLAETAKEDSTAPDAIRELGPMAEEAEARLKAFANPVHGKAGDATQEAGLRDVLSAAASRGLQALAPRWKSLPTEEAFGGAPASASASEPAWVSKAEELVATQLVSYLGQFFIQLRSLMLAVLVCSSLLLIAATSYPFHPEHLLLVFLLALVGGGVGVVVYVFLEMSRDETVSRVAKSSGRFSLDGFLGPLVTYVVPTLGILAAQLSGSFRWALEPILRVVK